MLVERSFVGRCDMFEKLSTNLWSTMLQVLQCVINSFNEILAHGGNTSLPVLAWETSVFVVVMFLTVCGRKAKRVIKNTKGFVDVRICYICGPVTNDVIHYASNDSIERIEIPGTGREVECIVRSSVESSVITTK
jgi:hypothetical protein